MKRNKRLFDLAMQAHRMYHKREIEYKHWLAGYQLYTDFGYKETWMDAALAFSKQQRNKGTKRNH